MFVKMSPRDQLDCLVDFVGITLLCLLPLPNCFSRVCFPTLFAAVLNHFLPQITSAISGAANSNRSAPMRFTAGMTYLRKKGIPVSSRRVSRAGGWGLKTLCIKIGYSEPSRDESREGPSTVAESSRVT